MASILCIVELVGDRAHPVSLEALGLGRRIGTALGATVYAAVFHSGNRTTVVSEQVVCNGGAAVAPCNVNGTTYPGGLPAPNTNVDLVAQPEVGLIVKFDPGSSQWRDQLGRNGGIQVGTAKARRALEAAVFVEHDARADQRRDQYRFCCLEHRWLLSQMLHSMEP